MALRNTFIILLSALLFTQSNAASDKDEFIGTWLLVHSQVLNESGNWEVPESSVGMIGSISYSANGYMSFQSSRRDRSVQVHQLSEHTHFAGHNLLCLMVRIGVLYREDPKFQEFGSTEPRVFDQNKRVNQRVIDFKLAPELCPRTSGRN